MPRLELKFRVYGPKGFEEVVFRNAYLFESKSNKTFTKDLFLRTAKWVLKEMKAYNRGVRRRRYESDKS